MKRREFTESIARQIIYTNEQLATIGCWLHLDWVKRSDHDQAELFKAGLSECDGVNKRSRHQLCIAADLIPIGILENGKHYLPDPMKEFPLIWEKVRAHWASMGGATMIPWDACHFE